jgi:hypothetical protein
MVLPYSKAHWIVFQMGATSMSINLQREVAKDVPQASRRWRLIALGLGALFLVIYMTIFYDLRISSQFVGSLSPVAYRLLLYVGGFAAFYIPIAVIGMLGLWGKNGGTDDKPGK